MQERRAEGYFWNLVLKFIVLTRWYVVRLFTFHRPHMQEAGVNDLLMRINYLARQHSASGEGGRDPNLKSRPLIGPKPRSQHLGFN